MSSFIAISDYDKAYENGVDNWESIVLNGSPEALKITGHMPVVFGSTMNDGTAIKIFAENGEGFADEYYLYHSSSGRGNYICGRYEKEQHTSLTKGNKI